MSNNKMWYDDARGAYVGYDYHNKPIAVSPSLIISAIEDRISMREDINICLDANYWTYLSAYDGIDEIDDKLYDPGMSLEDALEAAGRAIYNGPVHRYTAAKKGKKITVAIDGGKPVSYHSIAYAYALIRGDDEAPDFDVFYGWYPHMEGAT